MFIKNSNGNKGFKIVLTADHSLMTEFRGITIFGFITCAPTRYVPEMIYNNVFAPLVPAKENGEAVYAQYGLRKVEAALLNGSDGVKFDRDDVIVAHPNHLDKVIGSRTRIVALSTMDPLGIGPVTSSFAFGDSTPYNSAKFSLLMEKINSLRNKNNFKVVVGGGGAWQFEETEQREKYRIDHVVKGEADSTAAEIFQDIMDEDAKSVITTKLPKTEEIPRIVKPSINSLVEVSRGCGRHCRFCDPALRQLRNIPIDEIKREVIVNRKGGKSHAWLHAEDILLYEVDNHDFYPNHDAVLSLYKEINAVRGINGVGATHCSLSAAAADPQLISDISNLLRAGPNHWLGVQPGIETGSSSLLKKTSPNKAKPFSHDEWPDVVKNAISILNKNYWHPACTIMLGLPGEEKEDVKETIELVNALDNMHCILATLFFVPIGILQDDKYFRMNDVNKEQWELVYRCWKHNLREFNEGIWKATTGKSILFRTIISLIVKLGSVSILRFLNNYGKKFE